MSKSDKRLEKMRRNPRGDWRIEDVQVVCRAFGLDCRPPATGSHYTVSHASQVEIWTIPADRPIKAVYIRKLVTYIDAVRATEANAPNQPPVSYRGRTPDR